MIVATIEADGTKTPLSPEEARRLNKLIGLTDVDQDFIRAIEAGEIDGDIEIVEDDDHQQTILPFRPKPID